MKKKPTGREGASEWKPVREDLLAWPASAVLDPDEPRSGASAAELRAELERAEDEIRRLRARIDELLADNERLRARRP